ncbi:MULTISPECIES: transglycosylase family protein [Streptomycetaceae]|uniref:transglycosylase family protein n=1 Tax=Embleya scabrispora TaxID=159449 RepID=UPI000373D79C|nr:transglycosylase family protein [Embleya scabrispora]MYS85581.1 peptidoglycan DD-metalloendopeptidase family protein [Streptomyces sp. SID5474]
MPKKTRLALTLGMAGAIVAAPLVTGLATANAASVSTWDKVAMGESSGNWHINTGNGFYGGLQFTQSTWNEFGGQKYAPRADLATKDQQIAIAEKVLAVQGPIAWPNTSGPAGLTKGGAKAAVSPSTKSSGSAKTSVKVAPKVAEKPAESAPAATQAPKVEVVPVAAKPASTTTSYSVVKGDSLSKIAADKDVSGGWHKLYSDNRAVIGSNPNLIKVGQKLSLSGKARAAATTTTTTTAAKVEVAPKAAPKTETVAQTKPTASVKVAPKTTVKEKAPVAAKVSSAKAGGSSANASGYVAPVKGALGTAFGTSGKMWSSGSHTGQDFVASTGTPVKAITSGTVVKAGNGGAYGNEIVIKHADGKYSQYAHLSSIGVRAGATVGTGQQIGLSGATGNVTGPHLHFEIRTTPNYGSGINPLTYLRAHGVNI